LEIEPDIRFMTILLASATNAALTCGGTGDYCPSKTSDIVAVRSSAL